MQQFMDAFGLAWSVEYLKVLLRIVSLLVIGLLTLRLVDSALRRLVSIVPGSDASGGHRLERRAETIRHIVRSVAERFWALSSRFILPVELGYPRARILPPQALPAWRLASEPKASSKT